MLFVLREEKEEREREREAGARTWRGAARERSANVARCSGDGRDCNFLIQRRNFTRSHAHKTIARESSKH